MFGHIYKSRLKLLLRDRPTVFWTLLYPLILAVLFTLAFSNLSSGDVFKSIPIAVVDNEEYRNDKNFQSALNAVSDTDPGAANKLFHVTVASREQAESGLQNNDIRGYIVFDGAAHVVVKNSGIEQTILKEFMDSYMQLSSAYKTIGGIDPSALQSIASAAEKSFLENVAPAKSNVNNTLINYFALISMAAMFGGFWGKREIEDIQADLSPQGARINLAPVHKLKALAASICASVTIHFTLQLVLLAFMAFALNVEFGTQIGYIILTCFAGSVAGVSFGALIAALVRGSSNLRTALMLTISLIMSALAGMMSVSVKYTVSQNVPILSYINPANLITDAFYSLFYFDTHTRYFMNIGLLFGISVVFLLIVYAVTRRQKYASL